MKTKLLLISLLSFIFCLLSSQVPQGFNYQAIARDGTGAVIANQPLPVKITIQTLPSGGTVVWEEQHSSVTSNQFGLISLVVGTGSRLGGTAATFSAIDWNAQILYLKTTIQYPGTTWTVMGTTQLWSVPFSMVAKDVEGPVTKLGIAGTTANLEEALFEVKNRDGQIIFAVYNEGVRAYVSDGKKGAKGGFAVGGFGTEKAESQKFFYVDADSIRAYVDTTSAKGAKGGFAVGGFGAIKGYTPKFLSMTPKNYFIGEGSGSRNTTGRYNSFLGFQSGFNNSTGGYNAFFGYQSGYKNNIGSNNLFLGYQSGYSNTTGISNVFIGTQSGYTNTAGSYSVLLGHKAGYSSTASYNTFIGYQSGLTNNIGQYNAFMGYNSGASNTSGSSNVFIGNQAGYLNSTGSSNVFLGTTAGYNNTASNNVFLGFESGYANTGGTTDAFIGYKAGRSNTTGSSNVFVGNLSGYSNTSGGSNVVIGEQAGYLNSTGSYNVMLGYRAGYASTLSFNTFLGYQAGTANTTGQYNAFIGYNAGVANTSGSSNVFIGNDAGGSNTTAIDNVFIGYLAGRYNSTGWANVFIGEQTGEANTTGNFNLFAGRAAGNFNTTGQVNTFLGINAGNVNTTGNNNVNVGGEAGKWNSTGSHNVNLGVGAGFSNTNGNYNIMIGEYTGVSLTSGNSNIFIGPGAGGGLTNTSNKLFIDNSTADENNALIYGDFSTDYLKFNANVDIRNKLNFNNYGQVLYVNNSEALYYNGTYFSWGYGATYNYYARPICIGTAGSPGSYMLVVNGNAYSSGSWASSDARWKKNIVSIKNTMNKILQLDGVSYEWRTDEFPLNNFDHGRQIGLVAQDVEKIFPELVRTDNNGYKAVSYEKLSVLLLEGMKEQQIQIESYKSQLQSLQEKVDKIEAMLVKGGVD